MSYSGGALTAYAIARIPFTSASASAVNSLAGTDPGVHASLRAFSGYAQGRSIVLDMSGKPGAPAQRRPVRALRRHCVSLGLRRRTWCSRRSLLIFGNVSRCVRP